MTTRPDSEPDDGPSGAGPEADESSPGDGAAASSRRSLLRWGIVAIVVVFIIAVGVGFLTSRPSPTYDDASRERFVTACVADGGDEVRPACECLYAAVTEQIPYDRFVEVDEQLTAAQQAGEEIVLPEDIASLVPACQIPA